MGKDARILAEEADKNTMTLPRNCKRRLTDWKMNSSTRRRNSRLSQMNLTKPSLRCLAIELYPNFQDDCSKQKTPICHAHFFTLSAGLFLISLFSTTLHKLLVTLPANPCLSKLLSEFEKYLPNFKEQVAFFSPNKKCSSLIKPPNFVSSKISSVTVFTEVVAMISSIS